MPLLNISTFRRHNSHFRRKFREICSAPTKFLQSSKILATIPGRCPNIRARTAKSDVAGYARRGKEKFLTGKEDSLSQGSSSDDRSCGQDPDALSDRDFHVIGRDISRRCREAGFPSSRSDALAARDFAGFLRPK